MRRIASLALACAALAGCGNAVPTRPYDNNDLELLTGYTAKELCSCRFVMEQSAEYCANWVRASPEVATYAVDEDTKTVRAGSLLFWGAKARFVGERFGCVLE